MRNLLFSGLLLAGTAAGACPTGLNSLGSTNGVERCELKGSYLSSTLRLVSGYEYVINGGVYIGEDNSASSKLVIEPGVVVRGLPGSFISVMRGSTIEAVGTPAKPVVFTSLKETGRKRGEWGGLVLNGNAPINACKAGASVCEAISEGIKEREVKFGGNNPADNSGILKYVVVEFAGYPISQDNELNGITFNAVGSATEIDYIQVHMNADDGIEFFGGTVNAKHVVLTNNEDDSIDWDFGWTGKMQFVVVDQGSDKVDNGIEADNLKSPMNASPRSNPTISNLTLIGSSQGAYGMLLRRGTGAQISNTIITGFAKACVDIDDAETFTNASNGGLTFTSSILDCKKGFELEEGDAFSTENFIMTQAGNVSVSPALNGWIPADTSAAHGMATVSDDFFFEPVDFVGAFGTENWSQGWISTSNN